MQGKTLNFGLLGYGKHVERHVFRAFDLSENCALKSIGTRTDVRARQIQNAVPDARVYNSYDALLKDSELDAIYISLPNNLHAEWCINALEARKHVVCEKPLALNIEEVRKIKIAAEKNDRKCFEAFMYRFHPRHQQVQKLLAAGRIGQIRYFEAHYHYFTDDYDNIRLKKENGGGSLYDVGCYTLDAARFFVNDLPDAICGSWLLDEQSGVDIGANFQLFFKNGASALLSCGGRLPRANNYSICGTKGIIQIFDAFNIPANKPSFIDIQGMDLGTKERIKVDPANHFQLMLDEFARWLRGESHLGDCFGNGEQNALLMDAARIAASTRQLVAL